MAENTAPEAAATEPEGAAQAQTQDTGLVSDLSKVDPKALQSAVDKAVQQALRTRESKLRAEQKDAAEQAERKRLEEAGEFAKLREKLTAEVETLRKEGQAKDVRNAFDAEAIQAGLRDLSDLALVPTDTLDACVKDGKLDKAAVKTAVDELKKAKPYLFKDAQAQQQPGKLGGPTPGSALPEGESTFDWSADAVRAARNRDLAAKRAAPVPRESHLLASLLSKAGRP